MRPEEQHHEEEGQGLQGVAEGDVVLPAPDHARGAEDADLPASPSRVAAEGLRCDQTAPTIQNEQKRTQKRQR